LTAVAIYNAHQRTDVEVNTATKDPVPVASASPSTPPPSSLKGTSRVKVQAPSVSQPSDLIGNILSASLPPHSVEIQPTSDGFDAYANYKHCAQVVVDKFSRIVSSLSSVELVRTDLCF